MNIAIIIKNLMVGGAQKQSIFLAKVLNKYYNIIFFVLDNKNPYEDYLYVLRKNKINFYILKGNIFQKILILNKYINKNKINIIFTYLVTENVIGAVLKILRRDRFLIGGIRSNYLPKYKFLILKILNKYIQDYTIFNSYSAKYQFIKKGFCPVKSIVIENCFIPVDYDFTLLKKDVLQILSVGRFVIEKDYETALMAIKMLRELCEKSCPKFHYTIIGYGELMSKIEHLVRKEKLNDCVTIIPNGDKISVTKFYKKSDIFLNTSIFEGTSNSIMEAMGFGLPVVATDVGDTRKLVKNNYNGYLTEAKDFATIAQKLFLLINNEELRNEFSKNSYIFIKQNYSYEKFQNNYVKLITKLSKI